MGQAVLPFLGYVVLQLIVVVVGLNVVREREISASGVLKSWIFGQMLLFSVLQIMTVPMILLRWKFNTLFWSYIGVGALLFGVGCWKIVEGRTKVKIRVPELRPVELLLLMIIVLLILWQACDYFFGIHLDEDDARFLAQANDILEYGQLFTRYFETGELIGVVEPVRDITSPWSVMFAMVSRLLFTKPAIFAHTIYPTVEIMLVYCIYWLMGRELFKEKESQLSVVFLAIIINLFFTVTSYTQSTFSVIRIWQGKASVAAVIVPMLIYLFICLNRRNKDNLSLWVMVIATGCAACLMSGAGIPLSFIAIAILGLYNIVLYGQWKRMPLWVSSMVIPLGSGLLYLFLKG